MKLNNAETFDSWSWSDSPISADVFSEKTGTYMSQAYEDDYWKLKPYLLKNKLRLKDVYFEAIARMVWTIQKRHFGTELVVPWLAAPYGASNPKDLKRLVVNISETLGQTLDDTVACQHANGSTVIFTIQQLEFIRLGLIPAYNVVHLEPSEGLADLADTDEERLKVGCRFSSKFWKLIQASGFEKRRQAYEHVDDIVSRFVAWYDTERDSESRVPLLKSYGGDIQRITLSVHPTLGKNVDRIAAENIATRASVLVSALQWELHRMGALQFDTELLISGFICD